MLFHSLVARDNTHWTSTCMIRIWRFWRETCCSLPSSARQAMPSVREWSTSWTYTETPSLETKQISTSKGSSTSSSNLWLRMSDVRAFSSRLSPWTNWNSKSATLSKMWSARGTLHTHTTLSSIETLGCGLTTRIAMMCARTWSIGTTLSMSRSYARISISGNTWRGA